MLSFVEMTNCKLKMKDARFSTRECRIFEEHSEFNGLEAEFRQHVAEV